MISAIVLAAGESKRMGAQNKLLLPLGEKTLIENSVDNILASDVSEVVIVLGHQAERVKEVLQNRLPNCRMKFVENSAYQEGMTTSIQTGMKAIAADSEGVMVCLSDLPFLQTDELNELIHAFGEAVKKNEKQIVLPAFQGQRGNPVIFSVYYKSEILAYQGLNGCQGVIKQNPAQVLKIEMRTANALKDIDTKSDYETLVLN